MLLLLFWPIRATSTLSDRQDTIKTRMQLNPALYPGIVSTGSIIVRQEGTRALWKGLTPFAVHLTLK